MSFDCTEDFKKAFVGKTFTSFLDFDKSLKEFMKATWCVYRIRTCDKTLSHTPVLYRRIKYQCDKGDFGRRSRSRGLRHSKIRCCFCPARFLVAGNEEGLTVRTWEMKHNHPGDRASMRMHPEFRLLSEEEVKDVEPFLMENVRTDRIRSFVRRRFGKHLTSKDVWNLRSRYAGCVLPQDNLHDLLEHFRIHGRIYTVEHGDSMTYFSFSTKGQMELLNRYPEVIGMDVTYRTNAEGYYLCEVLVVDALGRGRAVMFAHMTAESEQQYKYVLEALRSLYTEGNSPRTFVVDKCAACMRAIGEVFAMANIVICKFHVMRAVRRNARRNDALCTWFREAMNAEREEEFNHCIASLQSLSPSFYDYVSRTWLPCKRMWATCHMQALTYGCTTNNRVESAHRWLKAFFENRYPILKSVKLLWQYALRIVQEHDDALSESQQKFKQYNVTDDQQRLLNKLTVFAADLVYDSICTSAIYRAGRIDGRNVITTNRLNHVDYVVDILEWTCACVSYTGYKLPCPHIAAAAISISFHFDMLPIHRRWLRSNVQCGASTSGTSFTPVLRRRTHPTIRRLRAIVDRIERRYRDDDITKIGDAMESIASLVMSTCRPMASTRQTARVIRRQHGGVPMRGEWNMCNLCGHRVRSGTRRAFVWCSNGHPFHIACAVRTGNSVTCVICDGDINIPDGDNLVPSSSHVSLSSSPSLSISSADTIPMLIQPTPWNRLPRVDTDESMAEYHSSQR